MVGIFLSKPFLVAIGAGAVAQAIKVLSFLLIEKKVNYKRFVQADGSPNMHTATMAALGMAVGFKDGFDSVTFVLAFCINILVCVDTLNVKNATSRHAEVIDIIIEKIRKKKVDPLQVRNQGSSYRPVDVFTGVALGILFAVLIF